MLSQQQQRARYGEQTKLNSLGNDAVRAQVNDLSAGNQRLPLDRRSAKRRYFSMPDSRHCLEECSSVSQAIAEEPSPRRTPWVGKQSQLARNLSMHKDIPEDRTPKKALK